MKKILSWTLSVLLVLLAPMQAVPQCVVPASGVAVQSASYPALANDAGKLEIMSCASACTFTLPNPPPTSVWWVEVRNSGAGLVTISRNSLFIDGVASDLTLNNGQGIIITTDGSNYFTGPSTSSPFYVGGGTAQVQTATGYPGITALSPVPICWVPVASNTGAAPTLAVNGTAATTIVKTGGFPLVANDLTTFSIACVIYNASSAHYELQNPQTPFTGQASIPAVISSHAVLTGFESTTNVVTLNSAVTAGQSLIGVASGTFTHQPTSCTDSASDPCTIISGGNYAGIGYIINATVGVTTMTFTFNGVASSNVVVVGQFPNITAFDKSAVQAPANVAFSAGPTATTTQANELLIGGMGTVNGILVPNTASGWITAAHLEADSGNKDVSLQYQNVTTTGAYTFAGTAPNAVQNAIIATFKVITAPIVVGTGTAAMATSAIGSGVCASAVTVSAPGVLTTDVIGVSFNGDPTAVTGYAPLSTGMLTIIPYPTANNVNFKVCNNTGSSITPGAITLNWRVDR